MSPAPLGLAIYKRSSCALFAEQMPFSCWLCPPRSGESACSGLEASPRFMSLLFTLRVRLPRPETGLKPKTPLADLSKHH